jgi:hypothetical protein
MSIVAGSSRLESQSILYSIILSRTKVYVILGRYVCMVAMVMTARRETECYNVACDIPCLNMRLWTDAFFDCFFGDTAAAAGLVNTISNNVDVRLLLPGIVHTIELLSESSWLRGQSLLGGPWRREMMMIRAWEKRVLLLGHLLSFANDDSSAIVRDTWSIILLSSNVNHATSTALSP